MSKKDKFWMFWLLGVIILGMLTSCKTKYVSVPEYHTEYVYHSDTLLQRDSVYVKDSVYVEKNGDTVAIYKTKYIYMDRWRDKILYRDSIKVDSIRVPYPVEKKLSRMERLRMFGGDCGLTIAVLAIIIAIIKIYKWLRARSHT